MVFLIFVCQVDSVYQQYGKLFEDEEAVVESDSDDDEEQLDNRAQKLDFGQFMAVLYKMQQGTLRVGCTSILEVIRDCKRHTKTFEQIMEVQAYPVPHVKLIKFAFRPNGPVVAEFSISGPEETSYNRGKFGLKITFLVR